MANTMKKALSMLLVLVMVLGIVPVSAFASEAQAVSTSDLPTAVSGLSIAYPYNTEVFQIKETPANRFEALTFESARNEVESAQMVLTPNFKIDSFELTMHDLVNARGNVIGADAFEVYVQHYITVTGTGNAPYWTKDSLINGTEMFKARGGKSGNDGTYPDALIPQDAAIEAGENSVAAGNNQGIWVNLNVGDAAPGTYTGYATLTVNGTAMQIPVSVRIYDVRLSDQVHMQSSFQIWWDHLQQMEGYYPVDDSNFNEFKNLAQEYFDYLVSKRIMPYDNWGKTRFDSVFPDYAAEYLAVAPEISSYGLYHNYLDFAGVKNTLTALIQKNISLAQSGSDVDLFKKAYFLFYDEPESASEYAEVNALSDQFEAVKNELSPMLADYPALQASFNNLKHIVTAQHPDDATYDKMWKDVGSTQLTGSYIYCPQYQYLNTAQQRAYYDQEDALWWYGCCFPTEPFATYHINSPLVAARAVSWMMYDYDIDGMLYASVNNWGPYNSDGSVAFFDIWNGYTGGTPGDSILVYPGSEYGVYGPIGTVRLENIRESNEDYEYLWLLENEYGITDLSAYTNGLYEGAIVTGVYDGQTIDPDGDGNTDAVSIHHNNRIAMLTKLEQLSIAKNGETVIIRQEDAEEDWIHMDVDAGMSNAGYSYSHEMVKAENSSTSLRLDTANAKINYTISPQWYYTTEKKIDMTNGILSGYFHFGGGAVYAAAELVSSNWKQTGRMEFQLTDVGDGWYYGTLDTSKYNFSATDLAAGADKANTIRIRFYFRQNLIIHMDGLKFENRVDKNDMFAGGSWVSGSQWTSGTNMTYTSDCTETYGEGSTAAWKFSATAANSNQWAQFMMGMTQAYDMRDYYLVFDAKVDGADSQNLSIRPRTGADGAKDPCNNTVVSLKSGWNTYKVDFAAALKGSSSLDDLTVVPRLFMVFDFAATTGTERSVIIDNVRLVSKVCQHTNTETVTVEATCSEVGSVTVICKDCGATVSTQAVEAKGHNYESVVTDPTPEAQGYTTHTCSRCGHSYVDSYTDYVPEEEYMVLSADMNVNLSLDKDLYINLNGFDMTGKIVTNGYKVYGIDATTDSYTCENIGYFNCVDAEGNAVVPENNHKSEQTGAIKRYLTIKTEEGYSFHRIYVGITHKTLQPGVTGVGYKAVFSGDDMVKAQLAETDAYGYNLWLEGGKPITRSKTRDSFVSGDDLTLRIKNFQVEGYGETKVYATVYLKLADGTVIESAEYAYSLREMVEAVNADYKSYNETQLDAVREMIDRNPVMLDWQVENILASAKKETIADDWTNMNIDQGMSNASAYEMSQEKVAAQSSQSLKITTAGGNIGYVVLNPQEAVSSGNLDKLPDFSSGKITAWFYFGDQRPMAFLRPVDSTWTNGVSGSFEFEDMGEGWYLGSVSTSEMQYDIRKTGQKINEIIRIAIEIPGDYTVYVDDMKWEPIAATQEMEKASDLLAVSTIVDAFTTIQPEISTDVISGIHSANSWKFSAAAGVSEKKSIRYELPKSYDLTKQALSLDVHRYDVNVTHGTLLVSLQDSNGNTVVDALVENIYWQYWNHLEVDLYKDLEAGKSLDDVKYITFTFNFDTHTDYDRYYYIDNVAITPYETYETELSGTSALYIGDSISIARPFKGWAGLLEERYGVERTNVSVGGYSLSTIGSQIKDQLNNIPEGAEYDYIILDGGINDIYLGATEYGKVSTTLITAPPSAFDDTTAIGAFEQLMSMLKRSYPNAKIGYVITYQRDSRWMEGFVPEVIKACDKWGVSYLCLPATDGFNDMFNENAGAHTADTVHATVEGYDLIMEYLPQWMASIPEPEIIEGFEPERYDQNDLFANGSYGWSASTWNDGNGLSWDNKNTEVYGENSIRSWMFGAAANVATQADYQVNLNASYDMDDYYFVFDAKVSGVTSQSIEIRPQSVADDMPIDLAGYQAATLTNEWQTYMLDFSKSPWDAYYTYGLADVMRVTLRFAFNATTGSDRQVVIDNVRLVKKETVAEDWVNMSVDAGMSNASYSYTDQMVKAENSSTSLRLNTANAKINYTISPQWQFTEKKIDMSNGILSGYFHFGGGTAYAAAELVSDNWKYTGRMEFQLTDVGDGWYYGTLDTSKYNFADSDLSSGASKANTIRIRFYFRQNLIVHMDGLKFEDCTDKNDLFADCTLGWSGGWSGGNWNNAGSGLTWDTASTETYGEGSFKSWKFTASSAVNANVDHQILLNNPIDMDGYYLVFDAKVEGASAQRITLRPRGGAEGVLSDLTDVQSATLTNEWQTFMLDFAKAPWSGYNTYGLKCIQRFNITFCFSESTGDRTLYMDNVRLVRKETVAEDWINMSADAGMSNVVYSYTDQMVKAEGSATSLRLDTANAKINYTLSPGWEFAEAKVDMTTGTLSGYFHFGDGAVYAAAELVSKNWKYTGRMEFQLTDVGDGWYYGTLNLADYDFAAADLEAGATKAETIRIRLYFRQNNIIHVDGLTFSN